MRGSVVVEDEAAFSDWLASKPTYAEVLNSPQANIAAGQAHFAVCSACHGAQGEGNQMLSAPRLAGQSGWYLKRQLKNFKHGLRGADSTDSYGAQMAPMAATLVDENAINNVVAYINTFPTTDAPVTITGDAARGEEIFITCKHCHGPSGKGIWSMNAPRLSGVDDWYLERQLNNYKQGIRGSHPADLYGKQMNLMSGVLRSEQAIKDVVAYINTL
jgi:cytochrome c oxidase subunit 2